jgi:hypothetical protein
MVTTRSSKILEIGLNRSGFIVQPKKKMIYIGFGVQYQLMNS